MPSIKSQSKYKLEMFAQDFNSPLKRNYIFTKAFFLCPTLLKLPRFVIGIVSRKNAIEYFYDLATWKNTHEAIITKAQKDTYYVDKLIDLFLKMGRQINQWSQTNVFERDLSKLPNRQLYVLLEEFIKRQGEMYAVGVMMPVLDFGSFSYVESNLRRFLSAKCSVADFDRYFKVFTYPLHDSFALKQEIDLLKLMAKYLKVKGWKSDLLKRDEDYIKTAYPRFYADIEKHAAKHGWVYYVYMGPAFGPKEFLDFICDYLKNGVEPKRRISEIIHERELMEKLRNKYTKALKPDSFNLSILKLAPKMVWAKPTRKDLQSKTYYHCEKLYREIGKRLNVSLIQAQSIPPADLKLYLLKNKPVDLEKINSIYNFHICRPNDDGTVSIFYGQKAKNFLKTIKPMAAMKIGKNVKEIKGTCAFSGRAKGRIKIINKPSDMGKMKDGDILASVATTPSIVPALKRAAAIVTDEGGLTCHASIVSRELKIPCLVGTGFVTRALKDGDLVEVDASKGVVRKVE